MNKFLMGLSYLLVLNFELVLFMVAGAYAGRYLNEHAPTGVNWFVVTMPISLLLCGFLLYRYLVGIIKNDQKKAEQKRSNK